jgi:hypothetical protein
MTILLPAPSSTDRRCSGIFVGCHRRAELGAPGQRSGFDDREALVEVRRRRGGFTAEGVQVLEHAPEDHPPIIAAAGALDEGESSPDAPKLLVERPCG